MTGETWRPVVGLENFFEVSDMGRVRSTERSVRFVDKRGHERFRVKLSKAIAPQKINSGYLVAHMNADGNAYAKTIHSLVAAAFIGPRPKGFDVCHENGDRLDNRAVNLRYDTRTNNHLDRIAHGTIYDGATMAKLSLVAVRLIRELNDGTSEYITSMAKAAGVDTHTIRRILRRELWKYVS